MAQRFRCVRFHYVYFLFGLCMLFFMPVLFSGSLKPCIIMEQDYLLDRGWMHALYVEQTGNTFWRQDLC